MTLVMPSNTLRRVVKMFARIVQLAIIKMKMTIIMQRVIVRVVCRKICKQTFVCLFVSLLVWLIVCLFVSLFDCLIICLLAYLVFFHLPRVLFSFVLFAQQCAFDIEVLFVVHTMQTMEFGVLQHTKLHQRTQCS